MPFEKFVENFLQNELDKINSSQRPSIKGESLINRVQELYNNPKSFNLEKFKELIAPLTKEEINHQDEYGNTALHYAAGVLDSSGNKADKFCAKPHKEMVLALSGHGANGYIKNGNRLTPLGLLTDSKNASTNPGERKKLEGLIGAVSKEKNDGTILSSATRLLGSAAGCTIG